MTTIPQEIQELEVQIQHIQEAIVDLRRPTGTPSSNSLVETVEKRLAKVDSDQEREKSVQVFIGLLEEQQAKLQTRQREEKARGDRVRIAQGEMSEIRRKSEGLVCELRSLLRRLSTIEQSIQEDWRRLGNNSPVVHWDVEPTLPKIVEVYAGQFRVDRLLDEDFSSPNN